MPRAIREPRQIAAVVLLLGAFNAVGCGPEPAVNEADPANLAWRQISAGRIYDVAWAREGALVWLQNRTEYGMEGKRPDELILRAFG